MNTIPFDFPGVPGVHCLFSTAFAGDMREGKEQNRAAFMRDAGFSRWVEVHQVHGTTIVQAQDALVDADGVYTLTPDTGLTIRTADCQPIFFTHDDGKAVAGLHVGWRGNAANFPGMAVKELCRLFSCAPTSLRAVRGPSLGPAASEFVNFDQEWPSEFALWLNAKNHTVNLWRLTRHQLIEAGMEPDHIFSIDMCTRDMDNYFFSYRRKDPERHVNAIWFE